MQSDNATEPYPQIPPPAGRGDGAAPGPAYTQRGNARYGAGYGPAKCAVAAERAAEGLCGARSTGGILRDMGLVAEGEVPEDEAAEEGADEAEVEWVQCEAAGCGRWRVLPAGVAAADLPALVPGWAVLRCKVAWGDTAILHCHWLPSAAIP